MSDIVLHDQGSVIGIAPMTEQAQDWFRLHVHSEDWQWLGNTLWIDQRMARDLIDGIVNAGLVVEAR